jgi:hypothetical protein
MISSGLRFGPNPKEILAGYEPSQPNENSDLLLIVALFKNHRAIVSILKGAEIPAVMPWKPGQMAELTWHLIANDRTIGRCVFGGEPAMPRRAFAS